MENRPRLFGGMMFSGWSSVIVHFDMDAFFAQIEERDFPWIRGKPVIIGGIPGQRGVASTCNYEARKYGIHAGMPLNECVRKCPNAIFIRTHGGKYSYVSMQVLDVLKNFSDRVEMTSIDEGYLDMTLHQRNFSSLEGIGIAIKKAIFEAVNLTCSIGLAPNKYVAKMCTGLNKPDGLTIMDIESYKSTFAPKPVSRMTGVGESTEKALNALGVKTIGQLQRFPESVLESRFGINGTRLKKLANGIYDESVVKMFGEHREEKSVGHESTFCQDESDTDKIITVLLKLCTKAARRLREGKYLGRRITLKLRYADFTTLNHQRSLDYFTNDEEYIYKVAEKCFREIYSPGASIRLIGIRVSHLQKIPDSYSSFQPDMFKGEIASKKNLVLKAADNIRNKFGDDSLFYAGAY